MKKLVFIILSLTAISASAGVVRVVGKPTQLEITNRLFFRIDGGVPQNPNNCSSNFRYEFVLDNGQSGENKPMALSILLTAIAMDKSLQFNVHDSICSDINYPAVIGIGFE